MDWVNLSTTEVSIGGESCILKLQRTNDADAMVPMYKKELCSWDHRIVLQPTHAPTVQLMKIDFKSITMEQVQQSFPAEGTATTMYTMMVMNLTEPGNATVTWKELTWVPAMELYPMRCEELDVNTQVLQLVYGGSK